MPGAVPSLLILLAGFVLGILFYGGLWLTVRALPKSRHAVLLALASFWGRTGLVIGGLLLAMDSTWQKALICLFGFSLARIVFSRLTPVAHASGARGAL